jgi:ribosomal protein S18 acetylase RimI-like enzyme
MPADPLPIALRPETPADGAFLLELYASTRKEEMEAFGWPETTRKAFLGMQFAAQQQAYRAAFPLAEFSVITLGGQDVGRMVVHRGEAEFRLVDIAVMPEHRGQGIGTRLIEDLLRSAKAAGKPVGLSVLKGQRPVSLYQRLGFRKTGEDILRLRMEWRGE